VFFYSFILGSTECDPHWSDIAIYIHINGRNIQNIDENLNFIQKCEYSSLDSLAIERFHSLKKGYFIAWKKYCIGFGNKSPKKTPDIQSINHTMYLINWTKLPPSPCAYPKPSLYPKPTSSIIVIDFKDAPVRN
jgi:hypothetical protein